jgi:MOSC domain-containing protein YiiM
MIRVHQLFISAGHNFVGHHGQPAGTNAVLEVNRVDCVAGRGLRGDRFFDHKENYKGQITFFSLDVFEALRRELKLPKAHPSATRRNALVTGVELNSLVGREFEIQGVRFIGVEQCKPCHWMDSALGPGAETWLQGRGGLRARILTDGILQCAE